MRKRHMTIQMVLSGFTDLLKTAKVLKRKKNILQANKPQADKWNTHKGPVMEMLESTIRGQYLLPL